MSKKISFQNVKSRDEVKATYESNMWDELSDYQKNCVRGAQAELGRGKGSHIRK